MRSKIGARFVTVVGIPNTKVELEREIVSVCLRFRAQTKTIGRLERDAETVLANSASLA